MTQTIRNTPAGGGYYLNPLVGLYSFPRGADLAPYAENFEVFDTDRNMNLQNWYTKNEDGSFSEWDQNPYWIKNRVTNKSKRYRALASISANIKATDWLSIQARGNVDYVSDKFDNKMYASTAANIAGKMMKQGYLTDAMYGRMNKTSKYMVISWPCSTKPLVIFHQCRIRNQH